MHTSTTTSRPTTILGFFMVISSIVLTSLTPVTEGIYDFDVLDVQDNIPSIAERLWDSLQGLSCGRMLICALEAPNEYGT
jgi:hypothetical protein